MTEIPQGGWVEQGQFRQQEWTAIGERIHAIREINPTLYPGFELHFDHNAHLHLDLNEGDMRLAPKPIVMVLNDLGFKDRDLAALDISAHWIEDPTSQDYSFGFGIKPIGEGDSDRLGIIIGNSSGNMITDHRGVVFRQPFGFRENDWHELPFRAALLVDFYQSRLHQHRDIEMKIFRGAADWLDLIKAQRLVN
jgi:hypothetical protein